MIRIITIDHSNPAEVADFHAAWKLPAHRVAAIQARCDATDQTWCPVCTEPTDEYSVEAFEILDLWCCPSCGTDALEAELAAFEEAEDRRRDNALESDFRRLGQ